MKYLFLILFITQICCISQDEIISDNDTLIFDGLWYVVAKNHFSKNTCQTFNITINEKEILLENNYKINKTNFDIINKITYYGNNLIKITNQTMKIERHNLFPEFILLHKLHNNFKYVLSNSPYIMYEKDFELFLFLNFLQNDISKFYYVNQDEKYC